MKSPTKYKAKKPDAAGIIHYTAEDNETWGMLMERQLQLIPNRACDEFVQGLQRLALPTDRIPQLGELNKKLSKYTGWGVEAVPALIGFDRFFALLAEKKFPIATFIRTRQELDYLQEPDIFHEIFGHCPLLTHQSFANFTEIYGQLGLAASKEERICLARLYWMTVEFGLVRSEEGLRIYGGGILSSFSEIKHALESDIPQRKPFELLDALRTPYRIDILQPLYYIIDSMSDLSAISESDIISQAHKAISLGLYTPLYTENSA
ncbi:MAG: phenylalanine 4-monooxygenase [Endozoicomonas sp. (ex Botrylloides leachii)]|nr:phenylalanine 4-monooxygenase [Endozoicomonas sp. (ex Botrylloides leachii)]